MLKAQCLDLSLPTYRSASEVNPQAVAPLVPLHCCWAEVFRAPAWRTALAMSSDEGVAALRRVADVVLTSEAGLTELYELKGALDKGSQAGCVSAMDRRTGVHYALHEVELGGLPAAKCADLAAAVCAQRRIADAPAELSDEMHGAQLALVREVLLSPKRVLLVTELAPTSGAVCDDLLTLLERRGRLAESDARRVFTRIVLATKRAHDCGAVLRNIKPESVQVRQQEKHGEFEVYLTQLHCAAPVPRDADADAPLLTGLHGTPEYCAPEMTLWYWHEMVPPRLVEPPPAYSGKADVWALGMCLHVMLCGCFPFQTSDVDEEELLRTINTAAFAFNDPGWRKVSEEALDLVAQLLQRDPLDRPCLEEVLQHAFCAEALQEAMLAEEALRLRLVDEKAHDAALAALDSLDDDDDDES